MTDEPINPEAWQPVTRLRFPALVIGVVALALCLLGLIPEGGPSRFFNAYLFSFLFWLGIALGSLALVFLHHLVGGNWGVAVRRPAEAAAMTMPLLLMLFVPILFGVKYLYPWADPSAIPFADKHLLEILQHQSALLNIPTAGAITVFMFIAWTILAFWVIRWGLEYDRTEDRRLARSMRKLCSFGLCFHVLTVSLLGILWVMSREAGWYSSILGFMILIGQALSAMVFLIIVVRLLARVEPMASFVTPQILNDLGNLFLTLVILWAYMSFAQLLIVWMGNTAVDTPWYVRRGLGQQGNSWKYIGLFLVVTHFFMPFFLLLLRWTKRQFERLRNLAIFVLVLRVVDVYWLTAPNSLQPMDFGFYVGWMDFLMPIGIGGIWFAAFAWLLEGQTMLPHLEPPDEDYEPEMNQMPTNHGRAHGEASAS